MASDKPQQAQTEQVQPVDEHLDHLNSQIQKLEQDQRKLREEVLHCQNTTIEEQLAWQH